MTEKEIHIEQLMMEKLTGVIGEKESHYLTSLLDSDAGIQQQWEKIKEAFEKSEPHRFLQNMSTDAAWDKVKEGIVIKSIHRKMRIRRLAVAASLLMPLLIAGFLFYHYRSGVSARIAAQKPDKSVKLYVGTSPAINLSKYKIPSNFSALNNQVSLQVSNGSLNYASSNREVSHILNTLVIPVTATYKITLSDGTEVRLNSMSKLKFPFTFYHDKREVYLEGEAYFKVTKDTHRPFIVHTPLTEIKVLGTEFNVNTYDSLRVKTSLVNGSVSTQGADSENIMLKPGYEAVFSKAKGFRIKAFDSNNTLSWMQGIYYFQNVSLNDITAVVRRWYGDTILFEDTASRSNRFTGAMLKDKPLTEFLDNLAFTSNIRYYTKDNVIHISAK